MNIQETVSQLKAERDKIDHAIAALEALEDTAGPAPTPAPRRRGRGRAAASRTAALRAAEPRTNRRAGGKVDPAQLLSLVSPEGVGSAELAATTGASQDSVVNTLKALEADGKVRRTGERRSTRWHRTWPE